MVKIAITGGSMNDNEQIVKSSYLLSLRFVSTEDCYYSIGDGRTCIVPDGDTFYRYLEGKNH